MQIKSVYQSLPKHPRKRYIRRPIRQIRTIVVHHSATTSGSPEAYARYHVNNLGWPGIGYHYVIQPDGQVYKTGAITGVRYHATVANGYGIGICLTGNFDLGPPKEAAWEALIELIRHLRSALPWGLKVIGHREVPGTHKSCPGKRFDLDRLRESL